MALSAAEGNIGHGQYSADESLKERLRRGDFLVGTEVEVPGWCMDGRPGDCAHKPLPRSAGATIGLWVAEILAGNDISLEDFLETIDPSEELISAHTGPTEHPEASGCGAADHLSDLIQILADNPQGVQQLIQRWSVDPSLIDEQVVNAAKSFHPDHGGQLVQTVADCDGSEVVHLVGEHKESMAVVNLRPHTTLNADSLSEAYPDAQVFHVDAWLFDDGSKESACLAALNAAALLKLTSPTLPYVEAR